MTVKDLSQYYYTARNIVKRENRLLELNNSIISSSKISDVKVSSSFTNNDVVSRIASSMAELKTLLEKDYEKLLQEEIKINEFLTTIEDEDIKYIIISRFLEFKNWNDIADEMHFTRTAPYYKLKNYLRKERIKNE